MLKKIFLSIFLILFFSIKTSLVRSDIYIFATVNDQIITNYDIKKEADYLKILNPNLSKIDNKKIFDLGKNSLIKEIIKKKR